MSKDDMDTVRHIKLFVILECILITLSYVASKHFESSLHPLLQDYLSSHVDVISTPVALISIFLLIVFIISSIGILFTKIWAKNLYIISTIALSLNSFFIAPTVDHAVPIAISDISSLICGMVLALLIYTNDYDNDALNKIKSSGKI